MAKCRAIFIITLFIFIILTIPSYAAEKQIYINGENYTEILSPKQAKGDLLVKARSLADILQAEIKWFKAIKTLSIYKDDFTIKMMVGNKYIQVNNKTIKSDNGLLIIEGQTYIPLLKIMSNIGYLIQDKGSIVYIFKPEAFVKEINWEKEGRQLVLKMDKITPYRINKSDNPGEFILEVDKVALASNFQDGISGEDYYLKIKKAEKRARLKFIITSKYPLAYHRDVGIEEEENRLLISFLPHITGISWKENQLEIKANGQIENPEISLLQNPRRLVLDIPGLVLNNYKLNLPYNKWIKDIRVSQFNYDPVILRVVIELKEDKYLYLDKNSINTKIVLRPGQQIEVSELRFEENVISFRTDNSIKPDIFTLNNPSRLVINLLNTVRGQSFPDNLELNTGLVKRIRTARFNEETVRIVLDMKKLTGYKWRQIKEEDGTYRHKIMLENTLETIKVAKNGKKTDIQVRLSSHSKYEVKKFSYPDRLVLDIEGLKENVKEIKLPEPEGLVKNIRVNQFSDDPGVFRIVFELEDYYEHRLFSSNPDDTIHISVSKESFEEKVNLIVVDPGHGGFDPGAIGYSGLQEKDVNLNIALKVRNYLLKDGYRVLMTREDDRFISLKQRVEKANTSKADLFVSIHINASSSEFSEGTETFLAPNKIDSSSSLAKTIQQELVDELNLYDRGVKEENLYVIKYTDMPAVLIEVGFISNPHEESLLESEIYRDRAARAIYRGITNYIEGTEGANE